MRKTRAQILFEHKKWLKESIEIESMDKKRECWLFQRKSSLHNKDKEQK